MKGFTRLGIPSCGARALLVAFLLSTLSMSAPQAAGAAWHQVVSHGWCETDGDAVGQSIFEWNGEGWLDSGETKGWLWYRTSATNNTWLLMQQQYSSDKGGAGSASVTNGPFSKAGTYHENGWHNGHGIPVNNVRTASGNYYCPG